MYSNHSNSWNMDAESDFFLIQTYGLDFTIFEAYQKSKYSGVQIQPFATWSNDFGLQLKNSQTKYERRSLSGVNIRVASIQVQILGTVCKKHYYLRTLSNPILVNSGSNSQYCL